MYTYNDFIKHQDQAFKGVQAIRQITTYPSVSITKAIAGGLKPTANSFISHFNRYGKLIHINNLNPRSKYKYSYFYDTSGRVVKLLEINRSTNVLSKENNIVWTDKDNFIEYIHENINTSYARKREIHHSFENDISIEEPKQVPMDEWYLRQTLRYDNIIEEIYDGDGDCQMVLISELNDSNQVIKSYLHQQEYDDVGEVIQIEDYYEPKEYWVYTYHENGLIATESFISNEPSVKTYQYEYDEQGHWVRQNVLIDNSLQYICERKLIYY